MHSRARGRVTKRVLSEVREHLGQQLTVPVHRDPGLDVGIEAFPFILGDRCESFEDVLRDTA